jgi:hypothetical protein
LYGNVILVQKAYLFEWPNGLISRTLLRCRPLFSEGLVGHGTVGGENRRSGTLARLGVIHGFLGRDNA